MDRFLSQDAEPWSFLCCWPQQAVEQMMWLPLIWDAMILMWCHCNEFVCTVCSGAPFTTNMDEQHGLVITSIVKCGMKLLIPFPSFNRAAVEAWEWISNFSTHFTVHVITYPCQLSRPEPLSSIQDTEYSPQTNGVCVCTNALYQTSNSWIAWCTFQGLSLAPTRGFI